jgi:hypothetical protein
MNGVVAPIVEWSAVERPAADAPGVYSHTVRTVPHGVLVALVEAFGALPDAPARAAAAIAMVERSACAPLPLIVQDCHRELFGTAGVLMSLALFDSRRPVLWWLGVGHLPGYVMSARRGSRHRALPLHGGLVGQQLPAVSATTIALARGDTVIVVTDSVHWDPGRAPGRTDPPSQMAKRLIDDYSTPGDAAVAMAVRYLGLAAVPARR